MPPQERRRESEDATRRGWSLRGRLLILWVNSLISTVAVGTMLVELYRRSAIDRVATAEAGVNRAYGEITNRYRFYTTGWIRPRADLHDQDLRQGLLAVLTVALVHSPGVEGGTWHRARGSLAYSFPTYEGTSPKTNLPAAAAVRIGTTNAEALAEEQAVDAGQVGRLQTLLLRACSLAGPIERVTAWTMTRVFTGQGAGY